MSDSYTYGFDEFEKKLIDLLTVHYPEEIEKQLKLLALGLQADIALNSPVDTGQLKRSWTFGEPHQVNGEWVIEVGSNLEYSPSVEFGHKTRNGGFVKGQHMVEISVKQLEDKLPQQMQDWLQHLLRELKL